METLFALLHVTAAVFIIGPMAILPMTGMRAIRTGNVAQVTGLATTVNLLGYLSLLVALFGFALVSFIPAEENLTFTTPWLLISIILYSLAATATLTVIAPTLKRAGTDLAAGTTKRYPAVAVTSGIVTLLLVAVTVLMVARPGAEG